MKDVFLIKVLAIVWMMIFSQCSWAESSAMRFLSYFNEVYQLMQENYYFEVERRDFDRFLKAYQEKIYPNLLLEKKSEDYMRWRSAAYLVDFLKQPDDRFSIFLPPKPAEDFAKDVYGQRIDLGIDGEKQQKGFFVRFVEPRSDAYQQGLREGHIILAFDGILIQELEDSLLKEKLNPLIDTKVAIQYLDEGVVKTINVISKEYFKQTVFLRPTGVADVYCLEIEKFNQGTPDDMARFMAFLKPRNPKGLIIDLRNNPGGPPLAARAIASFFLPNGELMVYFEGRKRARADLDIPQIPQDWHVNWPMVVLVNQGTGSASELFAGILQDRKRAFIIGENTAGQILLKSLFDLSDGSRMGLVVSRGHFPDGRPFPFDGVIPDEKMSKEYESQAVFLAAKYLLLKHP